LFQGRLIKVAVIARQSPFIIAIVLQCSMDNAILLTMSPSQCHEVTSLKKATVSVREFSFEAHSHSQADD